jgi:hypothetical protein
MNGAAAPEAVMGQIGNGIDQAGQFYFVILLILQRGWIKNRRSKHCGFFTKGNTTGNLLPAMQQLVFPLDSSPQSPFD